MLPPPNAMNHSNQAAWFMLLLALAVLGGAVALNLFLEHGRAADRETERLTTQARVIAENLEYQLLSTNQVLESIRDELPTWKNSAGLHAGTPHIKALVTAMPGIRFIGVLDEKGILRASNLAEFSGRDFSARQYFQTARQHPNADTLHVSPPFESAAGVYVLNLTRTVTGPRGEFAGVVTASLDPAYFNTLMMSVLYEPDMWDAVGHGDGTLFLMAPERKALHGMNLAQPGSFFTRHRDSGQTVTALSGTVYSTKEERLIIQRTVQPDALGMDQPLVVAVSRDLGAIFQTWRRNASIQTGLFGLISMVSVLGLYTYQRRQRRLKQQATDARALAERFSLALDHIPTYIYMKDRQRRYIYANRATLELFNCSKEELLGSVDSRFFPPETVARIHDIDSRVLEHGEDTTEEVVAIGADGIRRVYWEIKTPIYEGPARTAIWGLYGISTDITEREAMKAQLEQQAHVDYLTGLFNRRHFMDQGQAELARAQRYASPLSLLMLDVDHFKSINDRYGHKTGDLVLQKLSTMMRETLRTIDVIGRIGGEEFAILLPETTLEKAVEAAERLRETIADSDVILETGLPLRFTVSIGVVTLKERESDLDMLLSLADSMLYQAKESGRNRVCAPPE